MSDKTARLAEAKALAELAAEAGRQGRLAEAIANWQQATNLNPANAYWWAAFGRVAMRAGDEAMAATYFERAIEIKPAMNNWKSCLDELRRRRDGAKLAGTLALSADFYDASYRSVEKYKTSGDDSVYRPVWDYILDILKAQGICSVIDLGCGPGQFAQFLLLRTKMRYTGCDFSAQAIAMCRSKQLPAKFYRTDLARGRRFAIAATYDAAIATEFLEHVADDIAILRKLKPGRLLIGSVPNFDSFGHVRYFSSEAAVEQRYGPLLQSIVVKRFAFGATSCIYAFHGRLSDDRGNND